MKLRRTIHLLTIRYSRSLILTLGVALAAFSVAAPVCAQSPAYATVDTESQPEPSDLAVVRAGASTFVLSTTNYSDTVQSLGLDSQGVMTPSSQVSVGSGPSAIALDPEGFFAVVANSLSDDVSVVGIPLLGLGGLKEKSRTPSGGSHPSAVAISRRGFVLVTNRDSDNLSVFGVGSGGTLSLIDQASTGIGPSSVAESRGLVVVTNAGSGDLSMFGIGSGGTLSLVNNSIPSGFSPHSATFSRRGKELFVAAHASQPGAEDEIFGFSIGSAGTLSLTSRTPAGFSLTDIALSPSGRQLLGVSVNASQEDTVLAFDVQFASLFPDCFGSYIGGVAPSSKTLAIARRGLHEYAVVGEFDNDTIRTLECR